MTLLSRISVLVRDIALAYLFGASTAADLFFVAFRIPNSSVVYSPKGIQPGLCARADGVQGEGAE